MAAAAGKVEVPRDRWGKPLIIPPDGGKPIPYYRASSFADVLDDKSNLTKWQLRMAVKGLSLRPDLYLAATVTPLENKYKLNTIAQDAIEHAGGSKAASIGTSLHELTELLDRGEPLPAIPQQYEADIAAYEAATSQFENLHIERFMVNDELQVAGTPDRIISHAQSLEFTGGLKLCAGQRIGDLKTGGHADYLGKYCSQLAIYAHSQFYDPETGERTPIGPVSTDWGVIYHAQAGSGECNLYAVDLLAGWEAAQLAADVRAWRKRKGLAVAA